MFLEFVVAFAAIVILAFVGAEIQRRRVYRVSGKGPSHPNSTGVLGMLYHLFPLPGRIESVALRHFELYKKYGREDGLYMGVLGHRILIFVADPVAYKQIFTQTKVFPKFQLGSTLFLGSENLALANGDIWKTQRHIINPAFYNINYFCPTFLDLTDKGLDAWSSMLASEPNDFLEVSPSSHITNITIDILGKTLLGVDFGAMENKTILALESYYFLFKSMDNTLSLLFPFLYKVPTQYNKMFWFHLNNFNSFMSNVISKSRKKIIDQSNVSHLTLLDMMVASQDQDTNAKLSDQELRDNAVVFFLASHDTSAASLGFALYELGNQHEMQNRLYQEILNVVGPTEAPTYEQLNNMPFLINFVTEVLRLYPPVGSVIPRVNTRDCVLSGYHVPKGAIIIPQIWCTHHSDMYYGDNVDEFDPDRHSKGNIDSFANIPFGSSQRKCIGQQFSLIEQRMFLVRLLQRFKIDLCKVNRISDDFKIRLSKR
ncbi:cytochrome P450 [Acrasis kona]|uniref:Cytochrome P450 n=1 Tax=Acrasis kona TaxID=1008807 RepID=A0AAW2ZMZ7_9EUKA